MGREAGHKKGHGLHTRSRPQRPSIEHVHRHIHNAHTSRPKRLFFKPTGGHIHRTRTNRPQRLGFESIYGRSDYTRASRSERHGFEHLGRHILHPRRLDLGLVPRTRCAFLVGDDGRAKTTLPELAPAPPSGASASRVFPSPAFSCWRLLVRARPQQWCDSASHPTSSLRRVLPQSRVSPSRSAA